MKSNKAINVCNKIDELEIPRELSNITHQTKRFEEIINNLSARLSPYSRTLPDESEECCKDTEQAATHIGGELRELWHHLRRFADQLEALTNRLEI